MSHVVWELGPNASGSWIVPFDSDAGIVLVQPQPQHEGAHEHSLGYTHYIRLGGGKWNYGITVTNQKSETAHFRIRWTGGL